MSIHHNFGQITPLLYAKKVPHQKSYHSLCSPNLFRLIHPWPCGKRVTVIEVTPSRCLIVVISKCNSNITEQKMNSFGPIFLPEFQMNHYNAVIKTTMGSQITSLTAVYSTVYSDVDQRKHQSSASLALVWGIHRDRWIPCTKGQLRGKCFHLMTLSCITSSYCADFLNNFLFPSRLIVHGNEIRI